MKRHSFLSCYGPQFIHGLVVLAAKSKYRPATFFKKAMSMPNHFALLKVAAPRDFRAGDVRSVLWSSIAATWLVLGVYLFIFQAPLDVWAGFALALTLCAPFLLIALATSVLWLHFRLPR